MTTMNARIKGTMLGREGHGIPTCMLYLDYGGTAQGFGGYDLRHYGVGFIMSILEVVGVETWEELVGKHVRVEHRDGGGIARIGHIVEARWFCPEGHPPSNLGQAGRHGGGA